MYALLDGYHRYAASIITGRPDALCVIIEEPETPSYDVVSDGMGGFIMEKK
jgi:hypothetical protein